MSEKIPPIVPPPILPPPVIETVDPEVQFDENGRIADELSCRSCGYNLQGLHPEGLCPECGTSIVRSIYGDKLRYSDPAWISRLARGTLWIIIGLFTSTIGAFIIGGSIVGLAAVGSVSQSFTTAIGGLLGAGLSIITIIGVWWLTSPDPGQFETESKFSARVIGRWCILANFMQVPLQVLGYQPGQVNTTNPAATLTPTFIVLTFVFVLIQVIVLIGYLAILKYLARLAARIPHLSLIKNCRIVMWGLGIFMGLASVSQLGMLLIMPGFIATANAGNASASTMIPFFAFGAGACIFTIGAFVFGIWGIVLLFRFKSAFKKLAEEASAIWETPPASITQS